MTPASRRPLSFRRPAASTAGFVLLLALLALGGGAIATAQTRPPTDLQPLALEANPDSALAIALAGITGTPLTLNEAVAAALDQATDVRSARGAMIAAKGEMRSEKGAFDPELFAEVSHTDRKVPPASLFQGVDAGDVLHTKEHFASGGARVTLPVGTEISASLQTLRTDTNSDLAGVNPQYDANAALEFRQPLLKGFGPAAWGQRNAAVRRYEAARARYEDAVLRMRTVVEQTYWDLYAAERDLAVQRLLRDRAASFLNQAELRGRAGIAGPTVVANARVFLSEQEQALLDREESYDQISDRLGSLLGRRAAPGGETARFRPVDHPPNDFPVESEEAVVARAIGANRALAAAERDVASARALAKEAQWNSFPQFDLFGVLGGVGLAGQARPIVFGGNTYLLDVEGNRKDAASDAVDRVNPNWTFGARVSVPIGFRAGRGDHQRAQGQLEQAEQRYIAARRTLEENVRAAHRDLEHSMKRLEAARMGVDAALEQARVGLLEYGLGRTTSFDLVRLGADVASSQQRFSQALVRTAKAVAQLRWLTSSGDVAGVTSTGKTTP